MGVCLIKVGVQVAGPQLSHEDVVMLLLVGPSFNLPFFVAVECLVFMAFLLLRGDESSQDQLI